jgi:copper resistance protein D
VIWIHVLSAMVWIGGMVFISTALIPGLNQWSKPFQGAEDRFRLLSIVTRRFKTISWAAISVLLATGVMNVIHREGGWTELTERLLAVKLGLIVLILTLSGLHDFILGPRLGALKRESPSGPSADPLRRIVPWLARFNLALALAVVYLAVLIARG